MWDNQSLNYTGGRARERIKMWEFPTPCRRLDRPADMLWKEMFMTNIHVLSENNAVSYVST